MEIDLGTIITPSGALLIVDAGLLGMWAHDRAPVMPEGILDEEGTRFANRAVDAAIVGLDADAVGRQLGRQWNPRFVYDIPRDYAKELAAQVEQIAKSQRQDARLEILRERVPHRTRADHALALGGGAGQVQFQGMWAGVVAGVPTHELRVVGEMMPADGPDTGRLRRVRIPVREGITMRSDRFAYAMVDWARLLVVDLDGIGSWEDEYPLDGLADFVFRGADAPAVAKKFKATELEGGDFGWRDLPAEEVAERGSQVEEHRDRARLELTTDFRPHSHHYQLMKQVRASAPGSGIVTLGESRACGFHTTWGDGIFEIHRDLDASGQLLQLRIELGTEERQQLMREL